MKLINKIVNEMQIRGLSQKEVCDSIGVSTSTFSNWKTRGTEPPVKYVQKLCQLFNWNPADIISYTQMGEIESPNEPTNIALDYNDTNADLKIATEELIKCYNSLSLSDKARVMLYVVELKEKSNN